MKLYYFRDPENYYFASAIRRGTWFPPGVKICPECQLSRQTRISPLIIEWEPGSNVIGDFVWPGLNNDIAVTQRVKEKFEESYSAIEFGQVKYWQAPKLKRPIRTTKRSQPRVWLPYDGPTLWEIIPTNWCHLDHQRSGISIEKECSVCKRVVYKYPPQHQGRLVVDLATWNGEDIFHIYEFPGGIFCTERVKELVIQSGFTNVSFVEDGIFLD